MHPLFGGSTVVGYHLWQEIVAHLSNNGIKVFILLMLFYLALLTLKRMLPMLTLRDVPSELDWL